MCWIVKAKQNNSHVIRIILSLWLFIHLCCSCSSKHLSVGELNYGLNDSNLQIRMYGRSYVSISDNLRQSDEYENLPVRCHVKYVQCNATQRNPKAMLLLW